MGSSCRPSRLGDRPPYDMHPMTAHAPSPPDAPSAPSALAVAFRGRHLLALDVLAIVVSFVGSLALRFDFPSSLFDEYLFRYAWVLPLLMLVRIGAFISLGLYQRVWRYASVAELQAIVIAVAASSAIGYALVFAFAALDQPTVAFPRSIPLIDSLLLIALIGGMRFSFLSLRLGRQGAGKTGTRTLIVGAGAAGVSVARQVRGDAALKIQLVGFADDGEQKGHKLLGVPVLGRTDELQGLIREHGIGTVLFALPGADGPTLRRLVRIAEREGAKSLTVPSISEVVSGQVSSSLREVQVDDLLRRNPARIDLEAVQGLFRGRTVLITGAGGSIGTELSRQIVRYDPRTMYLVGKGEGSIYELMERIRPHADRTGLEPVILDVRDSEGVRRLFRTARPDVVFHAAAHKHVYFMERHPEEAVTVNVLGTANVLSAAEEADVPSLIFVSTDKAVEPTNVMGATKRVGELLVREVARRTGRAYVIVRFGNVLSSRGSVLPRFRRQLAEGGPITVSHPEARRFFMTVNEAVQLILQAAAIGRSGETFVLDMGEQVLIEDLARDLIELSGYSAGKDVQITYTGLLPGEKMSESLFLPDETPRRSAHESLWYAEDPRDAALPPDALKSLERAAHSRDREFVIAELERLVKEYRPSALPAEQRLS